MQESARRSFIVKVGLTAVGAALVVVGLIGIILPVMPGFLFLIPGLAILAGEYHWARRLLDKATPTHLRKPRESRPDDLAA